MKTLLRILFLLALPIVAQSQTRVLLTGTGAPSGYCNLAVYTDVATGMSYTCDETSHTWGTGAMPKYTALIYRSKGISLNAGANTDAATITGLPARYIVRRITFENASGTPTLATIGVFTGAGGTGTTVVTAQALASLSATTVYLDATLAVTSTVLTSSSLTIRNIAAAGSAMTVDCTIEITPLL